MKKIFDVACKYADIFTITTKGKGSILSSITYSEFTGKDLSYKENFDLTNIETLKLLDTWPDYKIF